METENGLWDSIPAPTETFDPAACESLPVSARSYLCHAVAPGTPLASAVRLQMTGEIKLKGWMPFEATQVIRIDQGFIWRAKVKWGVGFISGFDQLFHGRGEMRWKLLGLLPVMSASGPDTSRSAEGRMACESVWLPSVLSRNDVSWSSPMERKTVATLPGGRIDAKLALTLADDGKIESVSLLRWGNPDGGALGWVPFGGLVDAEAAFSGYTIPTRLRVGWHFGTDRFEEGEFFRCEVTHAEFR